MTPTCESQASIHIRRMKLPLLQLLTTLLLCGCEKSSSSPERSNLGKVEAALGASFLSNATDYNEIIWGGRFTADKQAYVSAKPEQVYFLHGYYVDVFAYKSGLMLSMDVLVTSTESAPNEERKVT